MRQHCKQHHHAACGAGHEDATDMSGLVITRLTQAAWVHRLCSWCPCEVCRELCSNSIEYRFFSVLSHEPTLPEESVLLAIGCNITAGAAAA